MAVSAANRCAGSGDTVTADSHKSVLNRKACRVCGRFLYTVRTTPIPVIPAHATPGKPKVDALTAVTAKALVKTKYPEAELKPVKVWAGVPGMFIVYADPSNQPYPVEPLSARKRSADAAWLDAAERLKRAERVENDTQRKSSVAAPRKVMKKLAPRNLLSE